MITSVPTKHECCDLGYMETVIQKVYIQINIYWLKMFFSFRGGKTLNLLIKKSLLSPLPVKYAYHFWVGWYSKLATSFSYPPTPITPSVRDYPSIHDLPVIQCTFLPGPVLFFPVYIFHLVEICAPLSSPSLTASRPNLMILEFSRHFITSYSEDLFLGWPSWIRIKFHWFS